MISRFWDQHLFFGGKRVEWRQFGHRHGLSGKVITESAESLWKHTVLLMSTDWLFLSSDLLMVILAWLLAACWMVKLTVLSMYVYVCAPHTVADEINLTHYTENHRGKHDHSCTSIPAHTHSLLFHTEGLLNPCLFFFSAEIISSCCFITDYFSSPVCHHSHKQNS